MADTQSMTVITTLLAVWGAVVSTGLAIIKVIELSRDRSKVEVSVKGDVKLIPKGRNPYGKQKLLCVTVVNKARRPVTITGCALLLPRRISEKYLFWNDELSAENADLTEGQSHTYYFDEQAILTKYRMNPSQYVGWAKDAAGKIYWSHNFLARLIRSILRTFFERKGFTNEATN
jgi:hypothetical protein